MATIYEVSKLAGVSLATVSRVINNNKSVKEETRQKVHVAMKQLNYVPNSAAKSLASNVSDCIGVLVSELDANFFNTMMGAIEAECRQHDKHIVVTASQNAGEKEKADIEFLISRNCDALILHVEAVSDEYLIELCNGPIPVVIMNRKIPQIEEHCIYLDNERGGYLATSYLLSKGHTEFVYVSGPAHKKDALQRLEGYKRALAEHGITFDESRVYEGNYRQSGGSAALQHFRAQGKPFSAVLCGNDESATGVMATARELGLDLPRDLSVFGFDNVLFSRYTYPTLSTVNNPVTEMGAMAARQILKSVYKKNVGHLKNQFLPEVIERDSVADNTK